MKKYDIAVIGGGFAGVAAAVSASRLGASVLIVERNNSFGGASSYCLVNPFMPYSTKINGEEVPLSQGIFKEIVTELKKRGACDGYSFLEEELKLLLNEMIEKENLDAVHLCLPHHLHCKVAMYAFEKDDELRRIIQEMHH